MGGGRDCRRHAEPRELPGRRGQPGNDPDSRRTDYPLGAPPAGARLGIHRRHDTGELPGAPHPQHEPRRIRVRPVPLRRKPGSAIHGCVPDPRTALRSRDVEPDRRLGRVGEAADAHQRGQLLDAVGQGGCRRTRLHDQRRDLLRTFPWCLAYDRRLHGRHAVESPRQHCRHREARNRNHRRCTGRVQRRSRDGRDHRDVEPGEPLRLGLPFRKRQHALGCDRRQPALDRRQR